ncbi:MAG: ecdysteroid 22-kinase family protein [Acidimicrobiia bacterium]|nr:ecdysteroid 22-kinase family protein [Acidimicrobiia bacterium]
MTATDVLCGQSGLERLVRAAYGTDAIVTARVDVGGGRGTFSDVIRLDLAGTDAVPATAVAKLPADNVNRDAAASSGAYRREAEAYGHLLPLSPVARPELHAMVTADDTAAFLLQDLTPLRRVDQLTGLGPADTAAVAETLERFHRFWRRRVETPGGPVDELAIRRSTVAGFSLDSVARGLAMVRDRWIDVTADEADVFSKLVANAPALVDAFTHAATAEPTLCHGDPRADNLCFAGDGSAVLFDWQQIAVQFGEADLAWLMATSLDPEVRRSCADNVVRDHGADFDRFRLGLVLPGLAALLLAQRQADHERTRRSISTSLRRIAAALADYEVATAA